MGKFTLRPRQHDKEEEKYDFGERLIGPAKDHLENELLALYWQGVKRELRYILQTLRKWQEPAFAKVSFEEENRADPNSGFDTFVKQVVLSSRQLASEYDREILGQRGGPLNDKEGEELSDEEKRSRAKEIWEEKQSLEVIEDIRTYLDNSDSTSLDKVRAQAMLLLQSAQFLDIDKVIEYRHDDPRFSVGNAPAVSQLKAQGINSRTGLPEFALEDCSECHESIQGSQFTKSRAGEAPIVLCITCYYKTCTPGTTAFTKSYKHTNLQDAIDPSLARRLCGCSSVPRADSYGRLKTLFPVSSSDTHVNHHGLSSLSCGLFRIGREVAEAKYKFTATKKSRFPTIADMKKHATVFSRTKGAPTLADYERAEALRNQASRTKAGFAAAQLKPQTISSLVDKNKTIAEFGAGYWITDAYEEVPMYMRHLVNNIPYGNTHMALRVGTIIIEIGAGQDHGGVLITSRETNYLQVLKDSDTELQSFVERSLLVTRKKDRLLIVQDKRPRGPKRYKVMMKQVVGGAFCDFFEHNLERKIVDALIKESKVEIDPGLDFEDQSILFDESLDRLMGFIKPYLSSRITAMLASISSRLLSHTVDIHWDLFKNTCQTFCDSIIDYNVFGPLVAQQSVSDQNRRLTEPEPLYLMSFVCRPSAYRAERCVSKFSVPNGLTEEYILKFHYGRREDSDMIDTLSEYWYDWGAFGGPVYKYQDIFPWDCTEAYGRGRTKCGQCNISKHLWAFPFDSWSIISLHLLRGRHLYPPSTPLDNSSTTPTQGTVMDDIAWFRNRMTILLGQRSLLTVAKAMARSPKYHDSTAWLHQQDDARLDRMKLGGIHRAQPFSHHFEKGAYHLFFIAEWAHLTRGDQIAEYEKLRDGRMKLPGPPTELNAMSRYLQDRTGEALLVMTFGLILPLAIAELADSVQESLAGGGDTTAHADNAPSSDWSFALPFGGDSSGDGDFGDTSDGGGFGGF
ncbi:hypothetical protein GQ44DRAFT_694414 [Phaeosphaeriaceae sp. PMI808]|nr:hypothetical protein GQ44DRAFT_694414 [Phaeosphaeriaceae sp. PMI808]